MGEQYVGIDLHRRRSVIVRMTPDGEVLETVRVDNDPVALSLELAKAGPDPEVVLEATYGWYWAADLLQASACRAAWRVSSSWSLAEVSMGPFHHAGELPHAGDALDGPPASTLIPPIAPTCRGSLSGRPHAGLRRESARRRSKGKDFAIVTFLLPARGCPHGRFDLTSRTNMSPSKRAVDSR